VQEHLDDWHLLRMNAPAQLMPGARSPRFPAAAHNIGMISQAGGAL